MGYLKCYGQSQNGHSSPKECYGPLAMAIVTIPVAPCPPIDATPTNVFNPDLKKNRAVTFQCDYLIDLN